RTSSFHSACDSRTVFVSSPIVTPWSVISTSGHAVQAGHSVNFLGSMLQSSLIWTPAHPTVCSRYRRKSYFLSMHTEIAIGELSRRPECNIETIRYYERIGLLPPAHRPGGRFRRYDADDVARLRFIRRARQLGFTLDEVRAFMRLAGTEGDAACAE